MSETSVPRYLQHTTFENVIALLRPHFPVWRRRNYWTFSASHL